MDEAGTEALTKAIRDIHGVDATWIESVTVREFFNRRLVWEGEVQVFRVLHPLTSRCYAWSSAAPKESRTFYAILQVEPIASAADAVRAALSEERRKSEEG